MNCNIDNKKERGWVLRVLDRVYPDGLDVDTLKRQLIDLRFLTSDVDIRGNVAYLIDKGLIKEETVGNSDFKREVVSLTANGKDLVDGNIEPVVGVDV